MTEQYNWLEDLRRRHRGPVARQSHTTLDLIAPVQDLVGGIFRTVAMDHDQRPGLVAVIDADERTRSATVVLLTAEIEMGGDRDLFLVAGDTGLAYDVLAQAEVFGYVWLVQLERRLGELGSGIVEQLIELQSAEPAPLEPDVRSGTPIVARSDVRWQFKVAELERLQNLTGPCTRQLIDGEPKVSIDPTAFDTPTVDADQLELLEYLLLVTDLVREKQAELPAWLLNAILDDELVAAWSERGMFDAYAGLLSLSSQSLPAMKYEEVPVDYGQDAHGDLALLRVRVLAERRRRGVTSVPMISRISTASAQLVEKVALPGGSLVQCVPVPTATQDRHPEMESGL